MMGWLNYIKTKHFCTEPCLYVHPSSLGIPRIATAPGGRRELGGKYRESEKGTQKSFALLCFALILGIAPCSEKHSGFSTWSFDRFLKCIPSSSYFNFKWNKNSFIPSHKHQHNFHIAKKTIKLKDEWHTEREYLQNGQQRVIIHNL